VAAGGGYLLGLATTEKLDLDRLVGVMDRFFEGRRIEALPVPYAALYFQPEAPQKSWRLVAARTGSLARAVGGSVANPFLFPGFDVKTASTLDPGADRVAATPIEEACRLFPGANLLAVNVSGQPSLYSARMQCPVLEVTVAPPGVPPEEVLARGPAYQRALDAGHAATLAALTAQR
jgi:hypothetical protein